MVAADDPALSDVQRRTVADRRNSCYVSAATVWEICIEQALGKTAMDASRKFTSSRKSSIASSDVSRRGARKTGWIARVATANEVRAEEKIHRAAVMTGGT